MKKNNKGFTLIELLAVVAILAIVAVLAYNQIANRTSKSKISTIKVNADRYIKAVNDMATMSIKEDVDYEEGTYDISVLQATGKIKMTGTLPTGGYVIISNYEVVDACLMYEDKYQVEFDNAVAKNVIEDGFCSNLDPSNETEVYAYTGEEQMYVAPETGDYKLEVWGAQGGSISSSYIGGYGGYSTGTYHLKKGQPLFINVGGEGASSKTTAVEGGYNGGGNGKGGDCETYTNRNGASGGGATSISTASGLLKNLNPSKVVLVAGGGGGAFNIDNWYTGSGGHAGGYIGNNGSFNRYEVNVPPTGGTQSSGGTIGTCYNTESIDSSGDGIFGQGGPAPSWNCGEGGGGGAGYYGGGGGYSASGAGGSGYIGNPSLKNKVMYCYNCSVSSDISTKTKITTCAQDSPTSMCTKKGSGYAKISLINNETTGLKTDVTYDYNVNNFTFSTTDFMVTDFTPDFDNDFIIEGIANFPSLGKRYLLAGNYNSSSTFNLEIQDNNLLRVYIKGSNRGVSTQPIVANTDIHFTFVWNGSTKSFAFKAEGAGVNASTSGSYSISGLADKSLRVGQDYRGGSTFGAYTLKSFKITQTYDYGTVITNIPSNITRDGYTFGGWYTSKTGGTQIPSVLMATDDTTYYAH